MKSDRHFGLVDRGHRGLEGKTVRRTKEISGHVIAPIHVTFSVAYLKLSYGKIIKKMFYCSRTERFINMQKPHQNM
jgi:hypothetical protein